MSDKEFKLSVGGSLYGGWKSLQVTRSLEQLAHSFSVSVVDRWAVEQEKVPISAGNDVQVKYGSEDLLETVTTGYIDEDTLSYDVNSRTLGFTGRSKTADLIDCSAIYKGGQWFKSDMLQIASDICNPFGIDVQSEGDILGDKIKQFALADGETAFQALERLCRVRGVVMTTDGDGILVFQKAGSRTVKTTIEYGVNVLRCSKTTSHTERFSQYIVKMQASGGGAEGDETTERTTTQKRSSTDSHVTRYRPLIVNAENEQTGNQLQKRADWERNIRAGRACRVSYTVQGWEHSTGLWEPNTLVRVKDTEAEIDDTLLIVTATHERGEQGTTTTLDLTSKEAFDVEQPLPEKKKKKGQLDY